MLYIIHLRIDQKIVFMSNPLAKADEAYLRDTIIPKMRPLPDDEYLYGPAAILRTPEKSSHVLDGKDVYWCIDWKPGLLAIRFSSIGAMHWAAFKRPESEIEENPQYNLVYRAWDPQFDEKSRLGWRKADDRDMKFHDDAFEHANSLHKKVVEECRPLKTYDKYFERCEKSPIWQGTIAMG